MIGNHQPCLRTILAKVATHGHAWVVARSSSRAKSKRLEIINCALVEVKKNIRNAVKKM